MKSKERNQARIRRQQGESVVRIAKDLKVAASSVARWVSDIQLTEEQLKQLKTHRQLQAANKKKDERKKRRAEQQKEGRAAICQSSYNDLLFVGTALYWAEGGKTCRRIAFTNSDSEMIKVVVSWLTVSLNIPLSNIKCSLNLHRGLDEVLTRDYWKKVIGNPTLQFYKTQWRDCTKGHRKNKLHRGVVSLYVHDSNKFYYVEGLIKGLQQRIMGA